MKVRVYRQGNFEFCPRGGGGGDGGGGDGGTAERTTPAQKSGAQSALLFVLDSAAFFPASYGPFRLCESGCGVASSSATLRACVSYVLQ